MARRELLMMVMLYRPGVLKAYVLDDKDKKYMKAIGLQNQQVPLFGVEIDIPFDCWIASKKKFRAHTFEI